MNGWAMLYIRELTDLPQITLISLGIIAVLTILLHIRYSEKAAETGPTILTTTGIFFTFLGIAVGLREFNVDKLQESVPELLAGLKTAFWASVGGVGGALTLKARHYVFGAPSRADGSEAGAATMDDLAESLRGIYWALAGESDTTLVSQLKLMRQDSNDRLDALKRAQTEALQMLSQMGSKALVEALRDVIKDFNARINEQFGENFKHLNEGVAKLLVWQEQHRQHVESMALRLGEILEIAEQTTATHKQVVDQSALFSKIAADIGSLLAGLETQKSQINSYAQSLGSLLSSAKDSIPQFEQRITAIATQLAQAATQNQQVLSKALTDTSTALVRAVESTGQASAKATEEHAAAMSRAIETAAKASAKQADDYNSQIAQLISKSKDQIDLLDATLSEELSKSLEALGQQLAALSEKFVSDYMPLTDRLREVVALAKAVRT